MYHPGTQISLPLIVQHKTLRTPLCLALTPVSVCYTDSLEQFSKPSKRELPCELDRLRISLLCPSEDAIFTGSKKKDM
ncbi:hypothetical protein FVE85_6703 [Porphyridium purpureum]|uniref:Uncharacterized protein n=1 Tax=Porphyridium purpureum TaxID=35688 RepID=A0A5J4Z7B8_PORPP|nr:hypothetical protein FVE85_6703 [Porphyridium purpureum]|eukprot:POR9838..scf295_1